jgi:NAD(P)-dependent dehydrogenase (short-subunit alcohol dehydrogenase family)
MHGTTETAFVTGAASGIGLAITHQLLDQGAHVVGADIGSAGLPDNTAGYTHVYCDVTDPRSVTEAVSHAVAALGRIGMLFNNAGVNADPVPLHELAIEDWDRVINVNLRGAFLVLREVIRSMLTTGGGAVVNTASLGSFRSNPGRSAYVASKGGVIMLTRAAALDYARLGIRVNAICPGPIDTPMVMGMSSEMRELSESLVPMGRLGTAAEVAKLAVFLASEDASFITGAGFIADGGRSAS